MKKPVFKIIILFLFASCGNSDFPNFDKFEYRFYDSSVPPEYHRSYTLTITPKYVSKWVDSYGDTISFEKKPITKKDFERFRSVVNEAGLNHCPRPENAGCTGGTGFGVFYYSNGKQIFKGSKWQCGGKFEGDLCGFTDNILTFLSSYFKDKTE